MTKSPNQSNSLPELRFTGQRILVVGDVMLDRYWVGDVRRLSPEAPAPIIELQETWESPGGAANVAASVAALGGAVCCAGVVGADADAAALRSRLHDCGVAELCLVERAQLPTITKTRLMASNRQQLMRLDVDGSAAARSKAGEELLETLRPRLGEFQAVCLADYEKGSLPAAGMRALIAECRRRGIPCVVDPKKADFTAYAGASIVAPNLHEAERALCRALPVQEDVAQGARQLRQGWDFEAALITQGPHGMTLAEAAGTRHFPAQVREVADVTGAGDTVVAVIACCCAAGWPLALACGLAGVAAGLAVSRRGVHVVTLDELALGWTGQSLKIVTPVEASRRVRELQLRGRTVVFTNGCFDLLHAGHLHCLEQARTLGDFLVVGLNSDRSVKLIKGNARPIIAEAHRAALLGGLECVNLVVTFDDATPEALVRQLAPDVLVKGGDYSPDAVVGAEFVRQRGGRVVTIPLVEGLSTTAILSRRDARTA